MNRPSSEEPVGAARPEPPTGVEEKSASSARRARRGAGGGVIASWVRLVVGTLIGFVQIPILFRYVPMDDLGVWYLFFAVATFLSLSDLGLPSTFGRAVAFRWGLESTGSRSDSGTSADPTSTAPMPQLYAAALIGTVALSFGFALVVWPAALVYFAYALPAGPHGSALLVPLALFLGGVVFNLVAAIPVACLSGRGDVTWDNALRTATTVLGFVLVCGLVPAYRSLTALCAIYAVQGASFLIASLVVLSRRHPVGRLRDMRPDWRLIRMMYAESAPVFVSRLGLWFILESTLLIAGYFLGAAKVADFGVLRQVIAIATGVTTAISIAVSPHASAAHSAGDTQKVRTLYLAVLRYSLVLNVLWTVGLLLWAPTVLEVMVGKEHVLGYGVLVPLVIGSFLELHGAPHGFFTWCVGKWPFTPYIVAGGVLNVALGSLGCALFGFEGLAWGSMLAQATTIHWSQVVYALGYIGVPGREYSRSTLAPALAYGATLAVAASIVKGVLAPALAPGLAANRFALAGYALSGIVATAGLAAALAWFLTLTRDDRTYFLRLLRLRH